ncbi:MAG: hypothetical protein ABI723_12270 [Bacteroidia bacterium]
MADDRLVEIMAELLIEVQGLRQEFKDIKQELVTLNKRVSNLELQQQRTNIELSEMRLSFMKLAEKIDEVVDLRGRVEDLEKVVFKKAS